MESQRGTREAGKDSVDTREAGEDRLDSLLGTGRQEGSIGQPARHREAGKNHLDSLRGTREAGKDQLDSFRGTRRDTREAGKDQLESLRGTRDTGFTPQMGSPPRKPSNRFNNEFNNFLAGVEIEFLDSTWGLPPWPGLGRLLASSTWGLPPWPGVYRPSLALGLPF